MKTVTIDKLSDYVGFFNSLSDTEFYRGLPDANFELIPSVGRLGIKDLKTLVQIEKSIFEQFKSKSPMYIDVAPSNQFEWLSLAQHHGLPTRLMDWTYNPLIALFFAVENESNTNAAVYSAYPSGGLTLETILNSPEGIFNTEKQAIHLVPDRKHMRFQNQNGLFTLHPDPRKCNIKNIVTKILIPAGSREEIRWRLRKIGITKAFVYNGLDGLSYDILQAHKISYGSYLK
jgi:hypothetical protein